MNGRVDLAVIIPTYNRPVSVVRLVEELGACRPAANSIIVVDSSDEPNTDLLRHPGVRYLRSRHKNQPYQRYVGALAASAPVVLFLDDDLYLERKDLLGRISEEFQRDAVVGVGVNFEHISSVPPVFGNGRGPVGRFLLRLRSWTRKARPAGMIDILGATGGMPHHDGPVQFLRGGAMAFRRTIMSQLFDDRLFAVCEAGFGMGEDKVISMRAGRFGQLWWIAAAYLRHPGTEGSHYGGEPRHFLTKVLVSRLHVAKAYCETFGYPQWLAYTGFAGALARALGSGMLRTTHSPGVGLRGAVKALGIVFATQLQPDRLCPGVDFWADAARDRAATGGQ